MYGQECINRPTRYPKDMNDAITVLAKQQGKTFSQLSRMSYLQAWPGFFISFLGEKRYNELVQTCYNVEDDK